MSAAPGVSMPAEDPLAWAGRSWAAMTPEERARYGTWTAPLVDVITVDDCAELLALALDFPRMMRTEGPLYVARRWARTDSAVQLARRLEAPDPMPPVISRGTLALTP